MLRQKRLVPISEPDEVEIFVSSIVKSIEQRQFTVGACINVVSGTFIIGTNLKLRLKWIDEIVVHAAATVHVGSDQKMLSISAPSVQPVVCLVARGHTPNLCSVWSCDVCLLV